MFKAFEAAAEPRILLEDRDFLAVYKPSGLHSAPLPGKEGANLCSWLFAVYPDAAFDPAPLRPAQGRVPGEGGLFHRLDCGTSGLVLFARSPAALASLLAAQDGGLVEKDYVALCAPSSLPMAGALPARGSPVGLSASVWEGLLGALGGEGRAEGEVLARLDWPLAVESRFRPYGPGGARVACLAAGAGVARRRGSPARVYRTSLKALEAGEASGALASGERAFFVARLLLLRGFRHQIRAHMAWIGLPLVGDPLYGGGRAERLFLHAGALRFPHPSTGKPVSLEC
jgi:23S rRNA pseudouridine1911/1915/1917 synthase